MHPKEKRQYMDTERLQADSEFIRTKTISGFEAISSILSQADMAQLSTRKLQDIYTELQCFILSEPNEELLAQAVQAIGWSFSKCYVPLYLSLLQKHAKSNSICHSCLLALDNIEPIGISSLSILDGIENAKRYMETAKGRSGSVNIS